MNLKKKVADLLLRRRTAKVKRQKWLFDFASSKNVGVLCAPSDETDTAHLKDFLQYLSRKNIKYSVMGYFEGKVIPEHFLYWKDIDAITRIDLDYFYIPKSPTVNKFINEPFDMLISCNMQNCFQLRYIAQLSVAKCKVGVMHEDESYCDLMIDISKNRTIEYFLKNLQIYLSNLRQPAIE